MDQKMGTAAPKYLEAASTQTLGEGIAEYYEHNTALLDPSKLPDEVAALFRQHDAGHVIFGCDTSLRGETLIDSWTIFATSVDPFLGDPRKSCDVGICGAAALSAAPPVNPPRPVGPPL